MKNSVSPPIVVVAIVAVLAAVGFFAMRTFARPSAGSTGLSSKIDASKAGDISQKDIEQMKAEMAKARGERAETTK